MARRGAWRPRRKKASSPSVEGDAADGGPRDRGPPRRSRLSSTSTTARSPAARGTPAADGPVRLCSASTASPPTSPRSRYHATAPRLAPPPARACASCSCIAVLNNGPDRLRAELQRRVEQRSTTSSNGCLKRPAVGSQIHKTRARLHEGEQQPLPHAEPDPDSSAATTSPSS